MMLALAVQAKNTKNAAGSNIKFMLGREMMLELEQYRLDLRALEQGIKELGDSL